MASGEDAVGAGFFLAGLAAALVAVGAFAGSVIMRDNIQDECRQFGQTNIRDTQYTCIAVDKPEGE